MLLIPSLVMAIDTAPRISDREIVERLTKLEEGQRNLEKRIGDFRSEMNGRFDDLRSNINARFDILQWMLGFFITIALVILGFVLRMQWKMQRKQSIVEATLDAQNSERAL